MHPIDEGGLGMGLLDYRCQWRVPSRVAGDRVFTGRMRTRGVTAVCAAEQGRAAKRRLPGRFSRSAFVVEVRAHRVGGEAGFPQSRRELVNLCRGVGGDALQDID